MPIPVLRLYIACNMHLNAHTYPSRENPICCSFPCGNCSLHFPPDSATRCAFGFRSNFEPFPVLNLRGPLPYSLQDFSAWLCLASRRPRDSSATTRFCRWHRLWAGQRPSWRIRNRVPWTKSWPWRSCAKRRFCHPLGRSLPCVGKRERTRACWHGSESKHRSRSESAWVKSLHCATSAKNPCRDKEAAPKNYRGLGGARARVLTGGV